MKGQGGMGFGQESGSTCVNMTEAPNSEVDYDGYGPGRPGVEAIMAMGGPLDGAAAPPVAGAAINHALPPPMHLPHLHTLPFKRLLSCHRGAQGGWEPGGEGEAGSGWREGPRRPLE